METELARHGYSMVIRHAADPAAIVEVAFDLMRGRVADAAVIPCSRLDGPWPTLPQGTLAPVLVPLVGAQTDCPYPTVTLRTPDGLREAVGALTALGHRRLLWIEPQGVGPERRQCVKAEADLLGLKLVVAPVDAGPRVFFDSNPGTACEAQSAVTRALPRAIRATAVLCWNDRLAYHALAALAARGLRVSEDVSLVGFDDFIAEWTVPALSTVSARSGDRAAAAARLALAMLERPPDAAFQPENVELPSCFIARGTTGPVKL
jgi:LacI family transcriptional regulator